jgi:chromosome segregation ATPase
LTEITFKSIILIMMRWIFSVGLVAALLFSSVAWAVEKAPRITDREIVERLTRLEDGQKALNRRIDDVNKRIDDLDNKLNKRIDDLRAEMNGRFSDLRAEMNGKFNDLRSGMNSRFESMNARFDTLQWMLGLFIAIALIILGFVLRMQWQMNRRQTSMEATLSAHKEELAFLRELFEKLFPPKGVL